MRRYRPVRPWTRGAGIHRAALGGAGLVLALALNAWPQGISFDNRREVAIPDYATLRVGPFYSTAILRASAGYRYTTSSGAGSDYLIDGRRGRILKDGAEIPVVVALDFLNYVPISRHSSLDASVRIAYRYYPLDTQEDDFSVTLPDEVVTANLAWDYYLTRTLRGTIYNRARYETDYVDTRGVSDDVGGRRYENLDNRVGTTLLWLTGPDSNLGLTLERRDLWVLDNEEEFGNQERTEYRERIFYERRLLRSLVGGASVDFIQRDFKDDERPDTDQTDYAVFLRGSEGAGIPLTERTTLSLRAGASTARERRRTTDADGDDTERTTFTGGADLRTQLTRYLHHVITYEHGLRSGFNSSFEEYNTWRYRIAYNRPGVNVRVFTDYDTVEPSGTGANESTYDQWRVGAEVDYPLTTYLTLNGSYVFVSRRYDDPQVDPEADAEERDNYYTRVARIGGTVPLTKKISWNTYVERYERLSDLDTLEFTRDTFETRLMFTHRF